MPRSTYRVILGNLNTSFHKVAYTMLCIIREDQTLQRNWLAQPEECAEHSA